MEELFEMARFDSYKEDNLHILLLPIAMAVLSFLV